MRTKTDTKRKAFSARRLERFSSLIRCRPEIEYVCIEFYSARARSNLHWSILPGQQEGTRVNYKTTAYDSVGNLAVSDNSGFTYEYVVVPEFPQLLVLPLFMVITLAAVILSRRKWTSQTHIERRIAL